MDFNYLWAAHIRSFKSFMDGKISRFNQKA